MTNFVRRNEPGNADVGSNLATGLEAIEGIASIHDRPIPGTRAEIDHIAIGPSGIYVIGTNTHRGAVVRRDRRLFVDSQDRSDLIAAMKVPVDAVASALGDLHFPISRALCFVGGSWPEGSPPFMLTGVWVGWANPLYALVTQPGRLQPREIESAIEMLDARLPAA
jgi:Nuclease-related domain